MNLTKIHEIETKCKTESFEDSCAEKYREEVRTFPSAVIQARIEFDAICRLKLTTPLQMQRASALKRELIKTLKSPVFIR
jgi:hypothetical protein